MIITTEEAEWLAKQHDLVRFTLGMKAPEHDLTAATIRSLAAERDALQAENARLQGARRLRAGRTTRKCVNAHDRCYGGDGGPCDYCEIVEKTQ